ncbi:hypothetical protein [Blastopirellula marina]|uniref:Uncharacterized protein n=1 Tax=Blastopirellula marina DSM 3645 TaxID=314230 RepID=A3ZYN6_9BACT|nr:hypothetical protein [Blastopirellula marina]EAQ78443.1 hypothetical protein DSM3645_07121 [Blastopirellula marina DSM 3645]
MKLHGMAIAFVFTLLLSGDVWAQQYKTIPMNAPELNPDDAKMRAGVTAAKFELREYLQRKPIDEAGKQLMTRFFMGAYFPSWTTPANWTSVDEKRRDFMRSFNGTLDTQLTSKKELNQLTLQAMIEMSKPDYHPVVRYNAMLTIGDLNAQEFNSFEKLPVCPYHAALDVLLKTLEDPKSDDVVRVAAMLGAVRHARYAQSTPKPAGEAMTLAEIDRLTKVASQVITSEVAEGHSADAHQWIQRRAMDMVRTLSPGYKTLLASGSNQNVTSSIRKSLEEVAKSLGQMLENEEADKSLRVDAAMTLAALPSDDAVKKSFDPNLQVGLVAKLASQSVDADITWFTEALKEMRMGGPGGRSYGGGIESYSPSPEYGYDDMSPEGGGKSKKPKKKEFVNTNPPLHSLQLTFRRRVKNDVDTLKVSLVGSKGVPADLRQLDSGLIRFVPTAEEQAAIIDLSKAMDELIDASDVDPTASTNQMGQQSGPGATDPYMPYEDLARTIKEKHAKLERLANKLAASAGVVDAAGEAGAPPSADMPFGAVPGAAPAAAPQRPAAAAAPATAPAAAAPSADMPFGAAGATAPMTPAK